MSSPVFMFDGEDPAMKQASEAAQKSFRYFWRELSWEARRIVPGLDMSMIKLPFTDGPRTDGHPQYEYMWVGEVDFDGDTLSGRLLNAPNWLKSVKHGENVRAPFTHLSDWMMTADGRAYGGFTVNLMRSKMDRGERKQHDDAWGLDFGDPSSVRVEIDREKKSKGGFFSGLFGKAPEIPKPHSDVQDHPMCTNMLQKIEAQLKSDGTIVHQVNDAGWPLLHREALAGNMGVVRLLVQYGAHVDARTPSGRTASELARGIGWSHIADFLDGK